MAQKLPSEHEADRLKVQEFAAAQEDLAKREEARLCGAVDEVLKNPQLRPLWSFLFKRCHYAGPVLMRMAGGDIAPISTEVAAAQREVYRDLRKMAAPELLNKAEFEAEFGVKEEVKGDK
jgi:hypothetical protein